MFINRTLQRSYTLLAPFYNSIVALPTRQARQHSFTYLGNVHDKRILLCGIGTGLDLPYLPPHAHYVGIDLTFAMLKRIQRPLSLSQELYLHQGDVMQLPYPDACFDHLVMHLILAVVPFPQQALDEAVRVLRPQGRLIILDKFLRAHQKAYFRRLVSPLLSKIATRTDVVFEELHLSGCILLHDVPALAGGWFRHLVLQKVDADPLSTI